ncbi:hypothetical protein ACRALDRAFT_1066043 [Sodiomyces alcalophilus JCM 7366]|uniref:uncharacterized protein n=1 Tax=Sodiomyces alcalophilus JCM 7366 TaxID=591952 RepID=UPI0039B3E0B1
MPKTTPPPDRPTVTFSSGRTSLDGIAFAPPSDAVTPPDLRILHFNDVYHIDPSSAEPVGGIARFTTAIKQYRDPERYRGQPDVLTFFSGDAFNPSLESAITKGEHMVPVLNSFGTDCACIGNHDLDFGVKQFEHLSAKCRFPWLLANVLDPALGDNVPLGHAKHTHMITASNGLKVGLIGLGEREWLDTINSLPPDIIYRSATATARHFAPILREQGADIVICITHMREPNDFKLARNTTGLVDIILGGHDHFYAHSVIDGVHVLRSGTDFKQLSYIEARRKPGHPPGWGCWDFDILRRDIYSSVPPDPAATRLAKRLTTKLHQKLRRPVGWTATPLDARFTTVRARESSAGNFVCDVMRHCHGAEVAIMASGTIRGDQVYPPGVIRLRDITLCFPFEDPVVIIRVPGSALRAALENGVSAYPALEGRFPQVSGIEFEFDPSRPPGDRVTYVNVGDEPLDPDRKYVVATRGYMARGKDGYDSLLVESAGGTIEEIIKEEHGILISAMLRQYFMALRTVGQWKNLSENWIRIAREAVTSIDPVRLTPSPRPDEGNTDAANGTSVAEGPTHSLWRDWIVKRRGIGVRPPDGDEDTESDLDDLDSDDRDTGDEVAAIDLELLLMRKFFHRWAAKVGVRAQTGDPLRDCDYSVDWTRVIAPVVEGRIKIVGS